MVARALCCAVQRFFKLLAVLLVCSCHAKRDMDHWL
jgi:hypothetical protein